MSQAIATIDKLSNDAIRVYDSRESNRPPRSHLSTSPEVAIDGLLDDDLIPDSRSRIRPAAIVEAKLNMRMLISRSSR
jgi:hypothetical protein